MFSLHKGQILHGEEGECDTCRTFMDYCDRCWDVYYDGDLSARFCCKSCAIEYINKADDRQMVM